MAIFSHLVATKMRPRLLSRHAAFSRIANLQRNGLLHAHTIPKPAYYPRSMTPN